MSAVTAAVVYLAGAFLTGGVITFTTDGKDCGLFAAGWPVFWPALAWSYRREIGLWPRKGAR